MCGENNLLSYLHLPHFGSAEALGCYCNKNYCLLKWGLENSTTNIAFDTKNTRKQIPQVQTLQNFYKPSQNGTNFTDLQSELQGGFFLATKTKIMEK